MTGAPDEGRLELDDKGAVVDPSGMPAPVVDLDDQHATQRLYHSPIDGWVSATAAPWLRSHHRAVAAVTAAVVALGLGAAWWTARPAPPPDPPLLALSDAPVVGAELGGPRITPHGTLSVAYAARAATTVDRVDIIGIAGPGLTSLGVERGAERIPAGELAFVQLGARITCDDRAIATARPSSYGLVVRTPASAPGDDRLLAFGPTTTALDSAIRDACLAADIPADVSVISADVSGTPRSSVASLAVRVRNDSDVALTVASERTPSTTVETDLSPTVTLEPHTAGTLTTRLLVQDCARGAVARALTDLPNPVLNPGYAVPRATPGLTVRLGLGDQWTLASYALPWTVGQLADRLAATACAGAPTVRARLTDVTGSRSMDGSWLVTGTYDVRTSGVGITLGREHFTGPAAGEGSMLATTDSLVPGVRWVLAPTQLDGGAGRLPVTFSGVACDDRDRGIPTSMPVRVITADRRVYPFELPLDSSALRTAVDTACSPGALVQVPGWGAVTPGATPAT